MEIRNINGRVGCSGIQQLWDSVFSRKIKSIGNTPVKINLDPRGVGQGYTKTQAFSAENIQNRIRSTGYISDFRGMGEEAIIIHGSKSGKVGYKNSVTGEKQEFSVKDFLVHIKSTRGIDLSEKVDRPLHVVSCLGLSNGVYQAFSNELKREVFGYGDRGSAAVAARTPLSLHLDEATSVIKSVIGDAVSPRPEDRTFVEAGIHRYLPVRS